MVLPCVIRHSRLAFGELHRVDFLSVLCYFTQLVPYQPTRATGTFTMKGFTMNRSRILLIVGLTIYALGFIGILAGLGSPLTNWAIPKSFTQSDSHTLLMWSAVTVLVGMTMGAYSRKRNS